MISGRSRQRCSFNHAIFPGWTSLAPTFLLLGILLQRLLNFRQSVLADLVSRRHLPDLRDKLVDVWLFLLGEPIGCLLEDLVVLVETGAIKRNLVAQGARFSPKSGSALVVSAISMSTMLLNSG
jgi:hypothetical protein